MFFAAALPVSISMALASSTLSIIPKPASMMIGTSTVEVNSETKIIVDGATSKIGKAAQHRIAESTGLQLAISKKRVKNSIEFVLDSKLSRKLGTEGYSLQIQSGEIEVRGANEAGLFYGLQSLCQVLDSNEGKSGAARTVPELLIEDKPRFSWRGAHMDVARHFMPKEFVLKFLDLMAMHKLNTFHWHLTDDQGWRIEVKKYPRLTEIGSQRKDTMLVYSPPKFSGQPHGGYYTQDDVREIVAYAKERFITVVPEIEMPGHAQAAIAAYPEHGNTSEELEVFTRWGVNENVFNVKDSTISFLQDVLSEMISLFPAPFIHVGGDECPKDQWKSSAFAQAKMKRLGLKDEHEMQSWFIRQMDQFLDAKGRHLIGWSEILEGGLAPGAALMVWLGNEGAMQAVSSGHDVVMAQTTHTYFDYYQSRDTKKEPHGIGGFLPLEKVYEYNPILPAMDAEQSKHVLGCQFQLWAEYISTPSHMEYMAFPRACAIAEVAWTPQELRNFPDFKIRLETHVKRLAAMGVNFRKLD